MASTFLASHSCTRVILLSKEEPQRHEGLKDAQSLVILSVFVSSWFKPYVLVCHRCMCACSALCNRENDNNKNFK